MRSSLTSFLSVPEPLATRLILEALKIFGFSLSFGVMDWIITRHLSMRSSAIPSISSGTSYDIPGIIFRSLRNGPIPFTASNCSYMSVKVNLPLRMAFAFLSGTSISASRTFSKSVSRSPIPNNLATKRDGMNGSMSCIFSPVLMNFIGAPVAATAERAPPPLAEPSSFVTKIEPIGVALLKALACTMACWPIVPSMTSIISSGSIFFSSLFISSISFCSSL